MNRNFLNGAPLRRGELDALARGSIGSAKCVVLATLLLASVHQSSAQIDANGAITSVPAGLNYDYTITLNNTASSTSPIETLWYAWVPGQDFLPTSPISVQAPAGWNSTITGGGPGDGFAIEFFTSTAPLNPGNSLLFQFQSADTPAELAGNSPTHPTEPVGTSVLYAGAPLASSSATILVQPVPEPSAVALLALGGVVLWRLRGRVPALRDPAKFMSSPREV